MVFGMTVATFTSVHVVLSLVGILSGFVVLFGMLGGKRLDGWTVLFLASTVATSVTGFLFPRPLFAVSRGGHPITCSAGGCDPGSLCVSPRGGMAPDLRGWRCGRSLSECLRRGRAGLPEGARPEDDGADTVRAAIRGHAGGRDGALRRAWHCRGEKVPQPGSRYGLIFPFSNSKDGVTMVHRDRA